MRVIWLLQKYPEVLDQIEAGEICFGTLDTWLVWKLTNGAVHATDYSNASSTAFFDPYVLEWSSFVCGVLGIPRKMLPEVLDTNANFGTCDESILGAPIPIRALVGDQQAAMFGQCCFGAGDMKLTLGTGAFLDLNMGRKAHASVAGFYPVVGWRMNEEIVHLAEGCSNTCGIAIDWLVQSGYLDSSRKADEICLSLKDKDCELYFVPAFYGIQAPLNDYSACSSLIGIGQDTRNEHIVRAVLESLAFRNAQLFESLTDETNVSLGSCVCDGGVSNSDFVLQLTADIIGRSIEVRDHSEMSALGAAFFVGLATGLWKDKAELKTLAKTKQIFEPRENPKILHKYKRWNNAVSRSLNWYVK